MTGDIISGAEHVLMHAPGPSPRDAVGGRDHMANDQPIKLCECGCGQPAPIATTSDKRMNWIKGQPKRFVAGHNARIGDHLAYILARCAWDGDCCVWQGARNRHGYGVVGFKHGSCLVHRVVYELVRGPIPDGLELDHVKSRGCHSPACCNVAHLEPVSHGVNVARGDSGAREAARTHCPKGHPYSGSNVYVVPKSGSRACRACALLRSKLWARRKRAKAVLPA